MNTGQPRSHAIEMVFFIVTGHAGGSARKFHVIIEDNLSFYFNTMNLRSGAISGH